MNKRLKLESPELYPVPEKSPVYHIGIHLVGPISPISCSGNRRQITSQSLNGHAKAQSTKEAKNVVSALKDIMDLILRVTSAFMMCELSCSYFFIMGIPCHHF